MAITDTSLMALMREKLNYLGQKQAVTADNVANANTPGYKAKDLKPFSFADAMKQAGKAENGGMKITNPNHIVPASMEGVNAGTRKMVSYETLPSGTSVDLEQQMSEVSKTTMDYQGIMAIYKKFSLMLKSAVGAK